MHLNWVQKYERKMVQFMHPWLVRRVTYPQYQKLRRRPGLSCLEELKESQWFSSARLQELQWKKLEKLLVHAYMNVPYYRELLDRLSLEPQDIKSPADLSRIPLLKKQNIRDMAKKLKAQDRDRPCESIGTSGSTGIPLTILKDSAAMGYYMSAVWRGRSWWGWELGDRQLGLWGQPINEKQSLRRKLGLFAVNFAAHLGENCVVLSPFSLNRQTVHECYKRMRRFRPKVVFGYASSLHMLAQLFQEEDLDGKSLGIQGIHSTAEMLYGYRRKLMESVFGCQVFNVYATNEVSVIAFQCPDGNMHITDENILIEFIRDAQPVGRGEPGSIVVTDLNNYSMPLIRYEIGDIGVKSEEKCSCGRGLSLLDSITGRDDDQVCLGNGQATNPLVFGYIFDEVNERNNGAIKEWKVVQKSPESFLIRIVAAGCRQEDLTSCASDVIKYKLGEDLELSFDFVDHIPREQSGKLRAFVSEIQ